MEITGKIVRVFDLVEGTSKSGNPWKKREYLLEVPNGQYPRQVFFNFFGERADQYILNGGQEYRISFDIESREYNGRYYTDIRAWKAENPDGSPIAGAPAQPNYSNAPSPSPVHDPFADSPAASTTVDSVAESGDDLPF